MDHCRDLAYLGTVGVSVLQTSLCAPLKSTCLYQLEDGTQQEDNCPASADSRPKMSAPQDNNRCCF